MENKNISENVVKSLLTQLLNEETSKVKREDFNRVQFKIEELQTGIYVVEINTRDGLIFYEKLIKN